MARLIQEISSKLHTLFNPFRHGRAKAPGHGELARHILDIQQQQTVDDIIRCSTRCLENYMVLSMFAFAVQTRRQIDVWLNSKAYEKPLKRIVSMDFKRSNTVEFHFFENEDNTTYRHPQDFQIPGLITFDPDGTGRITRAYLAVSHPVTPRHEAIIQLVTQSCAHAIHSRQKFQALSDAAALDPLTGCCSRQEFTRVLTRHIADAVRHVNDLSLLKFNLDNFGTLNDRYGRKTGDQILEDIAALVHENIRQGDVAARCTGDEFAVILPQTGIREAMVLSERLRTLVSAAPLGHGPESLRLTASFGVAELDHECSDITQLIEEADDMMHKAKSRGKNLVMPGILQVFPLTGPHGFVETCV